LNTDIVLGIAKGLLSVRKDFYVIIASATIDPKPFLDYFGSTHPCLDVPGTLHNVTIEYSPPPSASMKDNNLVADHVIPCLVEALKEHKEGHTLVFLPGQHEITTALKHLSTVRDEVLSNVVALPLYGSLPPEEQDKIMTFDLRGNDERMVVFCTNIAETSLTINNVRLVLDTGLAKEARFDQKRRLNVIELVAISKSSANQRKGRAGRTCQGHCIRLFAEEFLERENIEPEI
jgi:pre-mRNA-splicing factor ATP-dependent RNA helicase DHX16